MNLWIQRLAASMHGCGRHVVAHRCPAAATAAAASVVPQRRALHWIAADYWRSGSASSSTHSCTSSSSRCRWNQSKHGGEGARPQHLAALCTRSAAFSSSSATGAGSSHEHGCSASGRSRGDPHADSGSFCSLPAAQQQRHYHAWSRCVAAPAASSSGGRTMSTSGPTSGPTSSSDHAQGSASSSTGSGSAPSAATLRAWRTWREVYGLSGGQVQQLEAYLAFLLHVNQVMNLTAVRDPEEARERHITDSLTLLAVIEAHASGSGSGGGGGAATNGASSRSESQGPSSMRSGAAAAPAAAGEGAPAPPASGQQQQQHPPHHARPLPLPLSLIDVGTGAGLPGVVLAVARPAWRVTLLDSLRKRCDFLRRAVEVAGVSNVDVVWCRAEEGGRRGELRQSFDVAVARAVADTRVLAELCLPFVRVGGLWVAAKGPDPEAEVSSASTAITQLGGRLVGVERVASFSDNGQRTAVVVRKARATPERFPRPPGTPGKAPL